MPEKINDNICKPLRERQKENKNERCLCIIKKSCQTIILIADSKEKKTAGVKTS